jgi:hypothetical protein
MQKKSDQPPNPPEAVVQSFLGGEGPGPQEHEFSVLWEGPGKSEWNEQAAIVFEQSFLRCVSEGFWLGVGVNDESVYGIDIAKIFLQRLRDLKKLHHAQELSDEQKAEKRRKQRRISRRHGVCNIICVSFCLK